MLASCDVNDVINTSTNSNVSENEGNTSDGTTNTGTNNESQSSGNTTTPSGDNTSGNGNTTTPSGDSGGNTTTETLLSFEELKQYVNNSQSSNYNFCSGTVVDSNSENPSYVFYKLDNGQIYKYNTSINNVENIVFEWAVPSQSDIGSNIVVLNAAICDHFASLAGERNESGKYVATVNGWTWELSLIKNSNGYCIETKFLSGDTNNSTRNVTHIKYNYNESFYQTSKIFTYSDDSTENNTYEWSTVDLSTLNETISYQDMFALAKANGESPYNFAKWVRTTNDGTYTYYIKKDVDGYYATKESFDPSKDIKDIEFEWFDFSNCLYYVTISMDNINSFQLTEISNGFYSYKIDAGTSDETEYTMYFIKNGNQGFTITNYNVTKDCMNTKYVYDEYLNAIEQEYFENGVVRQKFELTWQTVDLSTLKDKQ